jgi:hypothetical protein
MMILFTTFFFFFSLWKAGLSELDLLGYLNMGVGLLHAMDTFALFKRGGGAYSHHNFFFLAVGGEHDVNDRVLAGLPMFVFPRLNMDCTQDRSFPFFFFFPCALETCEMMMTIFFSFKHTAYHPAFYSP